MHRDVGLIETQIHTDQIGAHFQRVSPHNLTRRLPSILSGSLLSS